MLVRNICVRIFLTTLLDRYILLYVICSLQSVNVGMSDLFLLTFSKSRDISLQIELIKTSYHKLRHGKIMENIVDLNRKTDQKR